MDVMKAVKNVLSWVFVIALIATMPQARADGMPSVRETPTGLEVDVPKFCRPLKVVWTVRWEQIGNDEGALGAMVTSMQKEKGAKVTSHYLRRDSLELSALWRGDKTLHFPKFDANGKQIKVKLLSIVAYGAERADFSKDNWYFQASGLAMSRVDVYPPPPVRSGTWGECS